MSVKSFLVQICAVALAVLSPAAIHAQANDTAVAAMIAAYGGDALGDLERIKTVSQRGVAWPGQGQTAAFVEFADDRVIKTLDLANRQGSVERWTLQNGNFYHGREIVDESGLTIIDYGAGHYTTDENGSFASAFAGDWRGLDLLIAKRIFDDPSVIKSSRDSFYAGHPTRILTVEPEEGAAAFEAFISKRDGLIRRVSFEGGLGAVDRIWSGHRSNGRFLHATASQIIADGRTIEIERLVSVKTNPTSEGFLEIEPSLTPEPAMIDTSQMTVEELAPGLFWVGQDDYSMFALHDGGWIAVSPYAGFQERFAALKEHTGFAAPLTSIIATHHHEDHLASIADAVALGADVVTTPEGQLALQQSWYAGTKPMVRTVEDNDRVGPFRILIEATAHSPSNIFVLHEASGVMFQEDHYHAFFADRASRIQPTAAQMWRALSERGLRITAMVSGHARKAEDWRVFANAVAAAEPVKACPSKRPICLPGWPHDHTISGLSS